MRLMRIMPKDFSGLRLDQALARLFPEYSRSRLQSWLKQNQISIDGQVKSAKEKVQGDEEIIVNVELEPDEKWLAEDIPLEIIYEDDQVLVINKPVGLVTHPAPGHRKHTLINGLLYHCAQLAELPRAGIIHRLDKDTSGLLLIAKTLNAHTFLVQQLQKRLIARHYEALVQGTLISGGTIEGAIGRHPRDRKKMAVTRNGKPARTHYRLIEKLPHHTHISVQLETGRTHQIRVHLAHKGYPIVGDLVYNRMWVPPKSSETVKQGILAFRHQALHAKKLVFQHPTEQRMIECESPTPKDLLELIAILKNQ